MSIESVKIYKIALDEWFDKTKWVQEKKDWPFPFLGMHRADVMKKYIEHLELKLAQSTSENHKGLDITFTPHLAVKQIEINLAVANKKENFEE